MDFLVFLAVSIAVYWQSRQGRGETQTFAFGAKAKPIPERLREIWWVRQIDRIGLALLLVGAVILPLVVTQPVAAPAVHHGPRLCALRAVAHRPHRLGRAAVARADGLRRHRCAPHRRLRPGRQRRHRLGRHPAPHGGIVPLRLGPSVVLAVLITAGVAALIGVGALECAGCTSRW